MDRPACSQLRTKLQEIKELKTEFDLELPKIKDTRDTAPALKLGEEIREKIKSIKDFLMLARCEYAEIIIGTKSKEDLIREIRDRKDSNNPENSIYVDLFASSMLKSPDFIVTNKSEKITLIRIKVKDLGFKEQATTDQIYKRIEELGLELCPPEIGPQLRLNYQEVFKREQAERESLYIGMKQISDSSGSSNIFGVIRDKHGERWLASCWFDHRIYLYPGDEFVFVNN